MTSKAQGISVNTIIIAALALIVLVVLIAVFGGRMGLWGEGMDKATKGIDCSGEWRTQCGSTETAVYGNFNDAKDNPGLLCCVSIVDKKVIGDVPDNTPTPDGKTAYS